MRYIFIVLFLVSFGSVSMGGIGDIIFCEMDETSGLDEFGLIKPPRANFRFKYDPETQSVNFDLEDYVNVGLPPFGMRRLKMYLWDGPNGYFIANDTNSHTHGFIFDFHDLKAKGSKITKESIDSFTASCFIQEDAT